MGAKFEMHVIEKINSYAADRFDVIAHCNYLKDGETQQLTYGQLIDYSDRLAFYLQEKLRTITRKVLGSFLFQVVAVTLILLMIIFALIKSGGSNISFVYNNFQLIIFAICGIMSWKQQKELIKLRT